MKEIEELMSNLRTQYNILVNRAKSEIEKNDRLLLVEHGDQSGILDWSEFHSVISIVKKLMSLKHMYELSDNAIEFLIVDSLTGAYNDDVKFLDESAYSHIERCFTDWLDYPRVWTFLHELKDLDGRDRIILSEEGSWGGPGTFSNGSTTTKDPETVTVQLRRTTWMEKKFFEESKMALGSTKAGYIVELLCDSGTPTLATHITFGHMEIHSHSFPGMQILMDVITAIRLVAASRVGMTEIIYDTEYENRTDTAMMGITHIPGSEVFPAIFGRIAVPENSQLTKQGWGLPHNSQLDSEQIDDLIDIFGYLVRLRKVKVDKKVGRLLRALHVFNEGMTASNPQDAIVRFVTSLETVMSATGKDADEKAVLLFRTEDQDIVRDTLKRGRQVRNKAVHGSLSVAKSAVRIIPRYYGVITGLLSVAIPITMKKGGISGHLSNLTFRQRS